MKETLIWIGLIVLVAVSSPLWMLTYAYCGLVDCFQCVRMLFRNWRKRK